MLLFTIKKHWLTFSSVVFLFCCLSQSSHAQGNLLVTPKRVVFEGNKKSEDINLANIGKDTATYVISFVQIRMNDDGSFEKITEPDPGQQFADKNLRLFPRTVTLAPNEAQTIKVQVIKTGEMQPGEYRSHLYLRANQTTTPLGIETENPKDSTLSVKLVPVFGISIPVIVRKGESNSTVTITKTAIDYREDGSNFVQVDFMRSGNMSLYGNVLVDYVSPQGTTKRVGTVKGMAIYTPNTYRRFQMQLEKDDSINYHAGKLKVTYTDQSNKPLTLATSEIALH